MKKHFVDQYHPTNDGFLSSFEFTDFEFQRMNFYLKKGCPNNFQVVLVPTILEGKANVFSVLSFLCVQEVAAMDFDYP
jgi:hypothetical protein